MAAVPPVVVIAGPTAVGKSRLALELAVEFGAAIVSADSRQVYRYMDIGTAKPTGAERLRVPHYMLDLVTPDQPYSARQYSVEARRVLAGLAASRRLALVVGGTGFYLRALLDGLSLPAVPPDPQLRARLRREAESQGSRVLHDQLRQVDEVSAGRIHPNNLPRIIRALEIVARLGGPVPATAHGSQVPALYLGLHMDRSSLKAVADRRVLSQMDAGLIEETRLLLAMGYDPALPALDGFGYRQMVAYLQGRLTRAQAVAAYQAATLQYIRRQMTWFRADSRITWLDAAGSPAQEARAAIARWTSAHSLDTS